MPLLDDALASARAYLDASDDLFEDGKLAAAEGPAVIAAGYALTSIAESLATIAGRHAAKISVGDRA